MSCSSFVFPNISTSSIWQTIPSRSLSNLDILFWKSSGVLAIPKGSLLKQNRPQGVINVVSRHDSGQRGIYQNPLLASKRLKTVAPINCPNKSSQRWGGGRLYKEHFHSKLLNPCRYVLHLTSLGLRLFRNTKELVRQLLI